ncbi:hypothetical protein FGO68_gene8113 [Halteria grandinella]|uniref:Uncharacterized protein n=1 Tax=Halteria grandinella TaxID=5974 RepID=A0A8J8P945_HALGN|nr:hypothetical protein FGO68_gene8113 [Halteria grandinella]
MIDNQAPQARQPQPLAPLKSRGGDSKYSTLVWPRPSSNRISFQELSIPTKIIETLLKALKHKLLIVFLSNLRWKEGRYLETLNQCLKSLLHSKFKVLIKMRPQPD